MLEGARHWPGKTMRNGKLLQTLSKTVVFRIVENDKIKAFQQRGAKNATYTPE
jgi:hypothetical protein